MLADKKQIYTRSEELPAVKIGSKAKISQALLSNGSIIAGNVKTLSAQQIRVKGDQYDAKGFYLPWGVKRVSGKFYLVDNPVDPGDF